MKHLKNWFFSINAFFALLLIIIFIIFSSVYINSYLGLAVFLLSLFIFVFLIKDKNRKIVLSFFLIFFIIYFYVFNFDFKNELPGSKIFYVYDKKEKYMILKNGNNYFYTNNNLENKIIGEKYWINSEIKKINIKNNYWEFDFKKYLSDINVKYELKIIEDKKINFFSLRFLFYKWIENKNDLTKLFIGQIKTGYFYDNLINLSLTFLINFSGFNLFFINYIFSKIVGKNKKLYNSLMPIIYIFIFLYIYLIKFNSIFFKSFLIILFGYIQKRWKIKIDRRTKFSLIWIINLIFNPFYIFNIGFVYVTIAFIFLENINENKKVIKYLYQLIWVNLIFLPLQQFYDYKIFWLSELHQIFLYPFITVAYLLTWSTIMFNNIGLDWYSNVLNFLSDFTLKINPTTLTGHFSPILLILYFLILYFFKKWNHLNSKLKIFLISMLSINLFSISYYNKFDNRDSVTMLNVNNGNSFFVKLDNKKIIVDAGAGYGISEKRYWNFLKYYGINKVDAAFISHEHLDHYNQLKEIQKHVSIRKIYRDKITFKNLRIGSIEIKNYQTFNHTDENENSQILLFKYKNKKILFTGDMTKTNENLLLKNYDFLEEIKYGVDFYQVPHHGSSTSNSVTFLKKINPKISFISSKFIKNRPFPTQETLNALGKTQTKIYNTSGEYTYKYILKNNAVKKL